MKICTIDCGHGGVDSGSTNGSYKEKDFTLKVGLKVKELLQNTEVKPLMTRDIDKSLSLQDRVNISNKNNSDIFVSIHWNSFTDPRVKGLETFSSISTNGDLATSIHKQLIKDKLYSNDRGVKHELYYVIKNTKARACLVELGFSSNNDELHFMLNNIDNFALSITNGILSYFGYKQISKPSNDFYYRVLVGSYKDKTNAELKVNELKKLGVSSSLVYERVGK